MRKIKVGIIQQANTADLRTNLMNLAKSIEPWCCTWCALVVLQELHNSRISVRLKTRNCLIWRKRFRPFHRILFRNWPRQ